MNIADQPKTLRKAVGIDLGTTFSAIAHVDAYGKPQIIPNSESERITPSVILFDGIAAFDPRPPRAASWSDHSHSSAPFFHS